MILNRVARRQTLWTVVLAVISGCTSGSDGEENPNGPDSSTVVPVRGVITLNGQPLAGAVVTFLPAQWSPGVGETDAKGEYSLVSSRQPGIAPGEYKVAISLLLSAEGEPQGVGPRSSLAQPPSMLTAKEFLPREYADLGSSKLTAVVKEKGGEFDFNVDAPGLVLPTPPATPAEEPATEEAAPAAAKEESPAPAPDGQGAKP